MLSTIWRFTILSFFIGVMSYAAPNYLKGYKTHAELTALLKSTAQQYPNVVKLESLGQTIERRDVWLVTLGASTKEKPAIAIIGNVEAANVSSSELCLQFLQSTAAAFGTVDSVTSMLNNYTFYIFPRLNPDASEQLWKQPHYNRMLNARPIDLDHDGETNEDGYDDLNGDGLITMMRILDPAGEWLADTNTPSLLRKADPAKNEIGTYKLFTEGIDNDNDGFWNEDPAGGVDMNQNFSFDYKPFVTGAGPHPVSEIESRAIADFFFAHLNINLVFSFSNNENLLHPWDAASDDNGRSKGPITKVLSNDAKQYGYISEQYKKMFKVDKSPEPVRGHGNFSPWAYFHYGRWSLSAPLSPILQIEDSTSNAIKDDPITQERTLYNWLSANEINGFVEWKEIDHPDFPNTKVEVGGFLPGVQSNPLFNSLKTLTPQYAAFFFKLAKLMPKLEVFTSVESLDKQVYRVTATIKNNGYLPTTSEMGDKSQWVRKVKAELLVQDGQKIVSGNRFYLINQIPGGSAHEQSWLVMGRKNSKVKIEVGSPSVGAVSKVITLK